MKLSEIIEMINKKYDKNDLFYHDYEIISCDDYFGVALVIDKSIKSFCYQIVIPDCDTVSSYYGLNVVRVFFVKELAENAYKALTVKF